MWPFIRRRKGKRRTSLVDFLNEKIDELAARKTTRRSPVVVVDQNAGFDATRGVDTYDGMHPNEQGGRKMATASTGGSDSRRTASSPLRSS